MIFSLDKLQKLLNKLNFNRVDFVAEPGEYSIRGGIVDIYSYSQENPYRLEFFDDEMKVLEVLILIVNFLLSKKIILLLHQIQNLILKQKTKLFKLLSREYYNMVKRCFICKRSLK